MPNKDKTGPQGKGPGTGLGLGPCVGNKEPKEDLPPRRGLGRGQGRGFSFRAKRGNDEQK